MADHKTATLRRTGVPKETCPFGCEGLRCYPEA
jgi:hypothetical protein